MPILVGIDGTGDDWLGSNDPSRNKHYDDEFANSFVKRICARHSANTIYFRGPGFLPANNGLLEAVWKGRDFILSKRRAGVNEPILLTGYSRGAAGVIVIAQMLGFPQNKIDVEAMLLFDCVDRDLRIDADIIPANVGYVLHVKRSVASHSRVSFGHSGTRPFPGSKTDYQQKEFNCTHGAMGGTPWLPVTVSSGHSLIRAKLTDYISEGPGAFAVPEQPTYVTYEQDARGAEQVQSFIKPFMRDHGFPIPPDVSYSSQLLRAADDRSLASWMIRNKPFAQGSNESDEFREMNDFIRTLPKPGGSPKF